jgi:hypothetical protein
VSNPPTRKPAEIELRFKIEQDPLTYLAMGNGHSIGKDAGATDIVRACVYTCAYLWMLAHPDFKPVSDLRDTAREYARWLLEPTAFGLLTAGARTGEAFDLASPRLQEFLHGFLASLTAGERHPLKLQATLPKGLWLAVKHAYGFRHGSTDADFRSLMAAVLRHARSVAASDEADELRE